VTSWSQQRTARPARAVRPGGPARPATTDAFLAEPYPGVLTTFRPDGTPHTVPVRFTWDPVAAVARVLTVASARKVRNVLAAPGSRATLCQVVGPCWATLEGTVQVTGEPPRVLEGARRYAERYGSPPPAPADRVVLEISVDRVMRLNV
jgi:PPOX class probable F420-dependent enzyme